MSDPQYNSVDTNALESVGGKKVKRKKISAAKTKKRFKENTVTVKTSGKKKHKTAKIKM